MHQYRLALLAFLLVAVPLPTAADEYCTGLWRARNALFARSGYCFESPEAQAIFGKGCFPPFGKLSPAEEQLVKTIKDLERKGQCGTAAEAVKRPTGSVPIYRVTVKLSQQATAKLVSSGETVRVAAYYYGEAKTGIAADDTGEIQLGSEQKDIETGDSVTLGGLAFPETELVKIEKQQPQLLINVYSSRKVMPENILDCDIWQDIALKAEQIAINCKLIGEK